MDATTKTIMKCGILPVITLERPKEDAIPLAQALMAGGVNVAEVTFRAAGADEAIYRMREADLELTVGAGTVTTREELLAAVDAGADFVVMPGFDPELVRAAIDWGVAVFPGCSTPSDYMLASRLGLEVVKFFPAELVGGLKAIKAYSEVFSRIKVIPTGGVNPGNLGEYLSCPAVVACGGSYLAAKDLIAAGNWEEITRRCKESRDIVRQVRGDQD